MDKMNDEKIEKLQRKLWQAERERDTWRGKDKHRFDMASHKVAS